MKKYILIVLQSLCCLVLSAQRSIGTPNADPRALLELKNS